MPWAIFIATNLLRTNGPSGPCFSSSNDWHPTFLPRPKDQNTIEPLVRRHRLALRPVIVDWFLVDLLRSLLHCGPSCSMLSSPCAAEGHWARPQRLLADRRRLNMLQRLEV